MEGFYTDELNSRDVPFPQPQRESAINHAEVGKTGLSLSELVQPQESNAKSLTKKVATSAAYAAFQSPLNGLVQIMDKTCGTSILNSVQIFSSPSSNTEFGTLRWHAQEIGNAAGMVLPFLMTYAATRRLAKAAGIDLQSTGALTGRNYRSEVALAGTTGIAYGAILTPSSANESLICGRLKNATEQGLTFATLTAAAGGLKRWSKNAEDSLAGNVLRNDIAASVIAGLPAGSVHADLHSLLAGQGFANWKDRAQSAYGFMFIGGTLGSAHLIGESLIFGANGRSTAESLKRNEQRQGVFALSLGEKGRLGSTEPKNKIASEASPVRTEPAGETSHMREEPKQRETEIRLREFLERPNPTSLAESCKLLVDEFRQDLAENESCLRENQLSTRSRIEEFNAVADRLELFAKESTPQTTLADLQNILRDIVEKSHQVKHDLLRIEEINRPAQVLLEDIYGFEYRLFADGTCLKTHHGKRVQDGHTASVVFVDEATALTIKDLFEERKLAGKSFSASVEHTPKSIPVQIGKMPREVAVPVPVVENGRITFPNVDGFSGLALVGLPLKLVKTEQPNPEHLARAFAEACRKDSENSLECMKRNAEFYAQRIDVMRTIINATKEFPSRFPSNCPANIFELPKLLRDRLDSNEAMLEPLLEKIYDHAPARFAFETEKGSTYRLYCDGSLGRLKFDGTKDRCENQYFTDPVNVQGLLEAANSKGLAEFSLPVTLEPAVGLSPLSLNRAGRTSRIMPTLVDGRLVWPSSERKLRWEGHVGHPISSLRALTNEKPGS